MPCAKRGQPRRANAASRLTRAEGSPVRAPTPIASARARPNGASSAAPRSGRPVATAATETTSSVPCPRYVKNPIPTPAPYRKAVTFREKKVRHQSGTWRRASRSGTGTPNASRSRYSPAESATARTPAAPQGASSREPIPPSAAPKIAAAVVAPTTWSPSAVRYLDREFFASPYTTGLMVSTIDSPHGPKSVDHPETIDATTSESASGTLSSGCSAPDSRRRTPSSRRSNSRARPRPR